MFLSSMLRCAQYVMQDLRFRPLPTDSASHCVVPSDWGLFYVRFSDQLNNCVRKKTARGKGNWYLDKLQFKKLIRRLYPPSYYWIYIYLCFLLISILFQDTLPTLVFVLRILCAQSKLMLDLSSRSKPDWVLHDVLTSSFEPVDGISNILLGEGGALFCSAFSSLSSGIFISSDQHFQNKVPCTVVSMQYGNMFCTWLVLSV